MKKTINLSLAVIAMTTSIFAEDIVKTDFVGDIKANYLTSNTGDNSLLDKDSSMANLGVSIGADFSIGDDVNAGIRAVYLDNAGLDGSATMGGLQTSGDDIAITEAYIAKRFGDTGVIIGRQQMQTPMLFTEDTRQNILYGNTFNAFTAMNKSIQGVTLVGAVVGSGNVHGDLSTFDKIGGADAVYVAGIMAEPMQDVKANVWYYNSESVSNVIWADAEINTFYNSVLSLQGAQATTAGDATTDMYGVRLKTEIEGIKLGAAYNSVNAEVGGMNLNNLGTNGYGSTSSLYTQMYMGVGMDVAGRAGETVDSMKLCAHKDISGIDYKVAYGTNFDESEYNLIANTKFGAMDFEGVVGAYDDLAGETNTFAAVKASYKF